MEPMERERFEELVDIAVGSLPQEFLDRLDNVVILVADQPTALQLRKSRLRRGRLLLGLYEGVPQTERGASYGMVLPDKITIFKKAIELVCRTEEEVTEQVRATVLHEIAHHFGTSDARLNEMGR